MYKPLISIVIPIFNREKTLHYCIDSILHQEYNNWELLLIDDGSTDRSAEICEAYKDIDSRINYYRQENQGAGPARNHGLQLAKGDWVTFVDSDDAIMPNHLSQVQKYGEGNDLIMVNHCNAKYDNGNLISTSTYWKKIESCQIRGNENIVQFLYETVDPYRFFNYCCWDKFFCVKIIRENSILFPTDVPTGQDMMFVDDYFKYTQNFYFSNVGTYAPTPMGNEGIEHLAGKLRHPREFFHCHKRNYDMLIDLFNKTNNPCVRQYAVHYIMTDTMQRAIIRFTHWRERRVYGKRLVCDFIDNDFAPFVRIVIEELDSVQNTLYKEQLTMIAEGKGDKVYDYWFRKNLIQDIIAAIKRRVH